MKSVTSRQVYCIIMLSVICLKFLFLPSLVSYSCGNNGYLAMFFSFLFNSMVLIIFAYLSKVYPDYNFKELLQKLFGKIIANVLLLMYFALFIISSASLFQSIYIFLLENLYEEFSIILFAISMAIGLFFVCIKSVGVFARYLEGIFILVVFSIFLSMLFAISNVDFSNLLPILDNGVGDLLNINRYAIWFGDYLIMIVLFGNFKKTKNFYRNLFISVGIVIFVITIFYAMYYCLYGNASIIHKNAIEDMVDSLPLSSDFGRMSWVIVLMWSFALFAELSLLLYIAVTCFDFIFPSKNKYVASSVSIILLILSIVVFNFNLSTLIDFDIYYVRYLSIFLQFVVPIVMLIASCFARKKEAKFEIPKT